MVTFGKLINQRNVYAMRALYLIILTEWAYRAGLPLHWAVVLVLISLSMVFKALIHQYAIDVLDKDERFDHLLVRRNPDRGTACLTVAAFIAGALFALLMLSELPLSNRADEANLLVMFLRLFMGLSFCQAVYHLTKVLPEQPRPVDGPSANVKLIA